MKRTINWCFMTLMLMAVPFLAGCSSSDGDEGGSLSTNIVGTWQSYKAIAYANGEERSVDIEKTGDTSVLYYEFSFEKDGTGKLMLWQADAYGNNQWVGWEYTYTINGEFVTVKDTLGNVLDLVYESKSGSLVLRINRVEDGMQFSINLYLKKIGGSTNNSGNTSTGDPTPPKL